MPPRIMAGLVSKLLPSMPIRSAVSPTFWGPLRPRPLEPKPSWAKIELSEWTVAVARSEAAVVDVVVVLHLEDLLASEFGTGKVLRGGGEDAAWPEAVLKGGDQREGLERRARLAMAVGRQVEGLLLEVVAAHHRLDAAGLVVDHDHRRGRLDAGEGVVGGRLRRPPACRGRAWCGRRGRRRMRGPAPYLSTSCWRSHSVKYGASESTSGFSISDGGGEGLARRPPRTPRRRARPARSSSAAPGCAARQRRWGWRAVSRPRARR